MGGKNQLAMGGVSNEQVEALSALGLSVGGGVGSGLGAGKAGRPGTLPGGA